MRQALAHIDAELRSERKGYVCLAGVHGVMEAHRDDALAQIFAEATLVVPDGMPTVWVGRHQGHRSMERVAGPDLMLAVVAGEEFRERTHFLCGGKPGVAEELRDALRSRFPGVKIVGTYTPPFGPMSIAEETQLTTKISRLKPDIIWVGISTPKQERFMARYLAQFETKLMFGVGAAFDFHTGRIKDCPEWVKRCGLQWLDRLLQDPRHLWKRYLRNNPAFLFAITLQLLGLKSYPRKRVGAFAAGRLPDFIRSLDPAHLTLPRSERFTLVFAIAVAVLSLLPLSRLSLAKSGASTRLVRPSAPFVRRFLPAMAIWSLVTGAFPPFASIFFVHHLGLSLAAAGNVFSLSQLVSFGAMLLAPVLFRVAGLQNGIVISQLSTASMLFALATVHSASSAGLLYWGYMAAQCMNEPGIYGLLMDRVPAADRSGASSYTFFISAVSQIVASSLVGAMIVRLGYASVLLATGSLAVLAALLFKRLANSPTPVFAESVAIRTATE